jgi:hypothetical protein
LHTAPCKPIFNKTITVYLKKIFGPMSQRDFAMMCIKREVARHGRITTESVRLFKEAHLTRHELKEAALRGLEMFEQWKNR